eukprot:gene3871-19634_t
MGGSVIAEFAARRRWRRRGRRRRRGPLLVSQLGALRGELTVTNLAKNRRERAVDHG